MTFIQLIILSWKTVFRQIKISVLLWAITAVCALPVFRVVHNFLVEYFGKSVAGSEWLNEFDVAYFIEFARNVPVFPGVLSGIFIVMLTIYYIVTIWTTGGVIGSLGDVLKPEPDDCQKSKLFFARFSGHGGRLFGRYFRLSVLTFALIIISLIPAAFGFAGIVLSLLLILFWIMLSDVTKISMGLTNSTQLFRTYVQSMRIVFRHILILSGLYLNSLFAVFIVFWLYSLIDNGLTANTAFLILLMFVIQQIWIGWRSLVRVQLFAAVMTSLIQWDEQIAVPVGIIE